MKNVPALIFFAMLFAHCNDSAKQPEARNADTTRMSIQIPKSGCYISVSGKDTIAIKIEVFPNVVTGALRYQFFEKDKSSGDIEGKLFGDTLLADYHFKSEGRESVREVIFLISDSLVTEGYGDMEERSSKMIFKDRTKIDFSKGLKLRQISCQEYDPAQIAALAMATPGTGQGGSETLYAYQWNLVELNGAAIAVNDKGSLPHLVMSPGKMNTVAGNTGCNNLRGSFELTGTNAIKFSPLVTTRMACIGANHESEFLDALAKADRWEVREKALTLNEGNKVIAKFNGVKPGVKPRQY